MPCLIDAEPPRRHGPSWAQRPSRSAMLLSAALLAAGPGWSQTDWNGQLRLGHVASERQPLSPLAQAQRWQTGASGTPAPLAQWGQSQNLAHAQLQAQGRLASLGWQARVHAQTSQGSSELAMDELFVSQDNGAWQLSAGRKLVSWDVGYAWRPNDMVAREARRPLLGLGTPGRPLLQAEWFGADTALSLVWVNPKGRQATPGFTVANGDEEALAARWYWRQGSHDLYAFARHGRASQGSLGLAFASVPADALELHGSWRWQSPSAGQASHHQALLGGTWTHSNHLSFLFEAWWDGAARSSAQWGAWHQQVAALTSSQGPVQPSAPWAGARVGQWMGLMQAFQGENLHRKNLLLRLSWDQGPWSISVDALLHPEDRGRSLGASAAWQGDRWRLEAAWRHYGGPTSSAMARLPLRQQAQLSALWSF